MAEPCNETNMRIWIEALESGEYSQTRGALRATDSSYRATKQGFAVGHCCLGVATEEAVRQGVAAVPHWKGAFSEAECANNRMADPTTHHRDDEHDLWCQHYDEILPQEVAEWLGIESHNPELPWLELDPNQMREDGVNTVYTDSTASNFNDGGMSFVEIARRLRIHYLGEEDPGPIRTGDQDA